MAKLPGRFPPNGGFYATATDGRNSLVTLSLIPISGTKLPGSFAPDGSLYITATDGNGNLVVQGSGALSVPTGIYTISGKNISLWGVFHVYPDLGTYTITGEDVTFVYTPGASFVISESSATITDELGNGVIPE